MATEKYAIDFDSVLTNIYKAGSGLVLSEPTVAAVADGGRGEVKAIGADAYKLVGKTGSGTKMVFPVFEGEIVNERVACEVLSGFLKKTYASGFSGAFALFSVPCGVTADMVEKLTRVAKRSGIGKVCFAESPLLSALGQRIPVNDSDPCFVIDMGGGTTSIAALSLDGIIAGVSVNFGGNKINTDLIDYIAENYGMQIGLQSAERIKKEVGSLEESDTLTTVVNGRDLREGTPRAFSVKASDMFYPVKRYYDKIAEIALNLLRKLPPEVSSEIRRSGVYVSGAPSAVYGLKRYYEQVFDVKVNVAEDGLYANALGGGMAISNPSLLKKITISTR